MHLFLNQNGLIFNLKQRRSLSDYYDTDLDDDLEMATSTVYESSTEVPTNKLSFSPTVKPAKIAELDNSEIPSNGARNVIPANAAQEWVFQIFEIFKDFRAIFTRFQIVYDRFICFRGMFIVCCLLPYVWSLW